MNPALYSLAVEVIRARGPLSAAEFMELALYHSEHGYYATADRRSGRSGDFYTSVDVGPLFGQLLAVQICEMWNLLRERGATAFHLVEAGAGDGRLARDILDALAARSPDLYARLRVTLVERSAAARARHDENVGPHRDRIAVSSSADLPAGVIGVILANELLDALPVHVVEMTSGGLREVHVGEGDGRLQEVLLPVGCGAVQRLLDRIGIPIPQGVRAEVGLASAGWTTDAATALDRGFLLLLDYGSDAGVLYSEQHPRGTLVTMREHVAEPVEWFESPGCCDLSAHVNLTAVRLAAVDAGLDPIGAVDQTYFLTSLGLTEMLDAGRDPASIRRRLAARTLIDPGGLGGTLKAMAFGKAVGAPALRGFASGRLT